MNNFRRVLIFLPLFFLTLTGCAVFWLGAGATSALVVGIDRVSIYIDSSLDNAWSRSYEVLDELGDIQDSDRKGGTIRARAKRSNLTILLEEVTPQTVKLTVKARKNLLPNVELAHDIAIKILKRLEQK